MFKENDYSIESDDLIRLLAEIDKHNLISKTLTTDELKQLEFEVKKQCKLHGLFKISKTMYHELPVLQQITLIEQLAMIVYYLAKNSALYSIMYKIGILRIEKIDPPLRSHFTLNDLQTYVYKQRKTNHEAIDTTIKLCLLDFELIRKYTLPVSDATLPCIERLIAIYAKQKEYAKAVYFIDQVIGVIGKQGFTGSKIAKQRINLVKKLGCQL